MKKSAIPRNLREDPAWFVTGQEFWDHIDQLVTVPYSPVTLDKLRRDEPSDYARFDDALQAATDHVWFDGISFRVEKPCVAIVGMNALDAKGRLSKYFRPVPLELGGYWEKKNATDVLGIVRADTVPHTGFGWFRSFLVFVWENGPAPISCQPLSGLNRDPALTNQPALQRFFKETRWDSIWVSALIKEKEQRRKAHESQLHLFRS